MCEEHGAVLLPLITRCLHATVGDSTIYSVHLHGLHSHSSGQTDRLIRPEHIPIFCVISLKPAKL